MQQQIIAQPDSGLVPFFGVTFGRFSLALVVAFGGGAFIGGIVTETAYEVAQGQFSALPYFFNGLGLLTCGMLSYSLSAGFRAVFFSLVLVALVLVF